MRKLTERQQRMAEGYAAHGNRDLAARQAGYDSGSNFKSFMRNPQFRAAIEQAQQDAERRRPLEAFEVVDGLRKIAFAPEDKASSRERLAALEMMTKILQADGVKASGAKRRMTHEEATAWLRGRTE